MWLAAEKKKILKDIEFCEDILFMQPDCLQFWDYIKTAPVKWAEDTMGKAGGGFWVVAVMGNTVIYYNDIEEGYNLSSFSTQGKINDYQCGQMELHDLIESLYKEITRRKK